MKRIGTQRPLLFILAAIGVFMFVWIYWHSEDFIWSLGHSLFIVAFLGIPMIGLERRKHRKHLAMPKGKFLNPLREDHSFEVEFLNGKKYSGLKGVYRGYFCRVYYDWNTALHLKWTSSEICVMIYYEPVVGSGKLPDKKRLDYLNKKYRDTGYFRSYIDDRVFETAHIRVHRALYWVTELSDILEQVDRAIELLEQEGLQPISESRANQLLQEDEYLHGPMVVSFVFKELSKGE